MLAADCSTTASLQVFNTDEPTLQGVELMAEYCTQCAKKYGMSSGFINECKPNYMANVICEGCGVIQVNHKGECVSHDCDN